MTDSLAHYGVKGMRWGVTRDSDGGDRAARRAARKEARLEKREDRMQVKLKRENDKFDKEDATARKDIERFGGSRGLAATAHAGAGIGGALLVSGVGSTIAQGLADTNPATAIVVNAGAQIVAGVMSYTGVTRAINIGTVDNGYRENFNAANRYDPDRAARAANK